MIKKITKLVLVTALQLQITLYMEILLFWYQPSKVPNLAHHCSDELPLYSQAVQLKPIWVVVCISRNQVWNAKIFLCLIKIYWLTAGKLGERGQRGGKEKFIICWVLLPVKTSSTKEAELTNSFAYTALASWYIMSRLLTKALKNRDQQPPCIASEHLEIVPHADRMINSSELQVLLHNTHTKKKGKPFLLKFNTYSKLLIIQDVFKCCMS